MKNRIEHFASFGLAAFLILAVVSCSAPLGSNPAVKGPTTVVKVALPSVSARLLQTMAKEPASRALMYLDSFYIEVYDQTTGYYSYPSVTPPAVEGPGNGPTADLTLEIGHTYDITLYGYNSVESGSPTTYGEINDVFISSGSTAQDVYLTMKPYTPTWMGYSYQYLSQVNVVSKSIYDATNETFTSIGGEKWFKVIASENVLSIDVTPAQSTDIVYAALFDAEGEYVTAGVSPSYYGGTSNVVNLTMGVTTGQDYYIGQVLISTNSAEVGTSGDVTTAVVTASIIDDAYDDGNGNDTSGYVRYVGYVDNGYPISLVGLKAYDQDSYQVYFGSRGVYSVTVTDSDANFPGGYVGGWAIWSPNNTTYAEAYSQEVQDPQTLEWSPVPLTTFINTVTITEPGYYNIGVDLDAVNTEFGFPMLAGEYSFDITFTSVIP